MAEGESSAEKTEEASDKKREDAREEGRVVTSKEVFVFGSLSLSLLWLTVLRTAAPSLVQGWAAGFAIDVPLTGLDRLMMDRFSAMLGDVAFGVVLVGLPAAGAVVLMQFAMGGLNFAPSAFNFKASKLNPGAGLARMVSSQAVIELGKAFAKVAALSATAWSVLQTHLGAMFGLALITPAEVPGRFMETLIQLVMALVVALGLIGGADLGWQIFSLSKSLRMTKQETKEEAKDQNGSPEVKGRIRRLQIEASRRAGRERKALADVPRATAVITNPTHFAVALRFVPGEDSAPVVLAQGKGPMAIQIIAQAKTHHVQVLGIPLLARALYYTGNIGGQISEKLYVAVAAVLAHVYRLERGEASDMPDVDLPPDMRFTPEGRVM